VRRVIPGVALALLAAGCQAAASHAGRTLPPDQAIVVTRPTPFTLVTEGAVHAYIPHLWVEAPLTTEDGSLRQGLIASPNLQRWQHLDGSVPGIEAAWVDQTEAHIPADYFYLAAKWPVLPRLAASARCHSSFQQVIVDHRPVFDPRLHEPLGDFAARASGTCGGGVHTTRWAYFVAAPSYGPVRKLGLPNSGLYMVVAVVPDGPKATQKLHRVLYGTRFGKATVADLMLAARESAQLQ
jgi:hypothetical protein